MIDWSKSRQPCPACDKGSKDTALHVDQNPDGSCIAYCHRCHYTERYAMADSRPLVRPGSRQEREQRYTILSDFGRALWGECGPLAGTIGEQYLLARHCVIPPMEGDLRYHPMLPHKPSGYAGPALVALVTDAITCEPISLHRTWIRADGTKAEIDPARMLLGNHRKDGGVIRLWPDEEVTGSLGVAEGIETALSLAHAHKPVWSLIDAGNLAKFPALGGIETLLIAVDNDPAGISAADACATRWHEAGAEVLMVKAAEGDINDLAKRAAA